MTMVHYESEMLSNALQQAEQTALQSETTDVDRVLKIARQEIHFPELKAVWRDAQEGVKVSDLLFPSRKAAALLIEDSVEPQAVGHVLVQAAFKGCNHCVRKLREIQVEENLIASLLMARFTAFAFLKAAEAGHVGVIHTLLKPTGYISIAIMGHVLTTAYEPDAYPHVKIPLAEASDDWLQRLASCRTMLPAAAPSFLSGFWEVKGRNGPELVHEAVRAAYGTYFLWWTAVVAAANGRAEVFKELLKIRELENTSLADKLNASGQKNGYNEEARKIIASRARIDTLMYQLVEELSTRQHHDAILHTLWSHIQWHGHGSHGSPQTTSTNARIMAQARNGLWELQVDMPLLLMPVEQCFDEDEPFRRYKQLNQLFSQQARLNIQLVATVEAMPDFLQVTVGIKHVRFKVKNSLWDEQRMGHFPSLVFISVTPETTEGTGVTMSKSSANQTFKIGVMERVQIGAGISTLAQGARGALGVSAGKGASTTVKNTPWRFEQLPVQQDRGGSFVWTLQAMKGQEFNRLNPPRMAESTSIWRFGKRVPANPLSQLPFTSEGGVIFSGSNFDDTLIWRLPKSMEGTKLSWRIQGRIHSSFITQRYWETRNLVFNGNLDEKLVPLVVKDKDADKGEKKEKKDKDKKSKDEGEDGEAKAEKKDKKSKGEGEDEEDGKAKAEKKKDKKDKKSKGEGEDEEDGKAKAEKKKDKKDKKSKGEGEDEEDGKAKAEKKDKKSKDDGEDGEDGEAKAEKKDKKDKKSKDEGEDGEDGEAKAEKKDKKSKDEGEKGEDGEAKAEKKKDKKDKKIKDEDGDGEDGEAKVEKKKDKKGKKSKGEGEDVEDSEAKAEKKKDKKEKKSKDEGEDVEDGEVKAEKKDKKGKKSKDEGEDLEDGDAKMEKKKDKKSKDEGKDVEDGEAKAEKKDKKQKKIKEEGEDLENSEKAEKKDKKYKKSMEDSEHREDDEDKVEKKKDNKDKKSNNKGAESIGVGVEKKPEKQMEKKLNRKILNVGSRYDELAESEPMSDLLQEAFHERIREFRQMFVPKAQQQQHKKASTTVKGPSQHLSGVAELEGAKSQEVDHQELPNIKSTQSLPIMHRRHNSQGISVRTRPRDSRFHL